MKENRKIRFALIGSGWRSLYYVRIAKALPDVFEMCGMLCRTDEKAEKMRREYGIPAVTAKEEIISSEPDYVVVAVDKKRVEEVALEWLERGYPVLSETPTAMDMDMIDTLLEEQKKGRKLIIAEQYHLYPLNSAVKKLLKTGLIGRPDYLYLSLAHEYHGTSLMRQFLDIPRGMSCTIRAEEHSFPVTETLSRYERFSDGRISEKKRMLACFAFENGRVCLFDFDSEQYRSPIRSSHLRILGAGGEISDDTVRWLDKENQPHSDHLKVAKRVVNTDDENPNLRCFEEVERIEFRDDILYEAPFGLVGLSEDETAVALLLREMGKYVRNEEAVLLPLDEVLEDVRLGLLMNQAAECGETLRG